MASPVKENNSFRFLDSYKEGHKVLVYNSFVFQKKTTSKRSTYFRCSGYKKGNPATITVYDFDKENSSFSDYKVTREEHQNHEPNSAKIKKYDINIAVCKS